MLGKAASKAVAIRICFVQIGKKITQTQEQQRDPHRNFQGLLQGRASSQRTTWGFKPSGCSQFCRQTTARLPPVTTRNNTSLQEKATDLLFRDQESQPGLQTTAVRSQGSEIILPALFISPDKNL